MVVEGTELLSVAFEAGARIEAVYVAPEGRSTTSVAAVVDRVFAAGIRVFDLAPGVLGKIADTVTPQPVLAVVGFEPAVITELREASTVLVCVDVRDPGNAGTIIRIADAAGIDAVVCCDGTVDATNPKTVRASAGSIFHVPVVVGGEALGVLAELGQYGFATVGTVVRGGTDYAAFDWRRRVAIVLGNEASGLDGQLTSRLDHTVSIPMVGRAESLNVSVCAAVVSFEAQRQGRVVAGAEGASLLGGSAALADAGGAGTGTPSTISEMERDRRPSHRSGGPQ